MSKFSHGCKDKPSSTNYATLLKHIEVTIEPEIFSDYLSEQFAFISNRDEVVSFLTFYHWIQLPLPFAERLFAVLVNSNSTPYISREQFIQGLTVLYFGSIELQLDLLFKLFDWNSDSKVLKEDMSLLFVHLFAFSKGTDRERGLALIEDLFEGNQLISFQQFNYKSIKTNSNCFYLFTLLIAMNRPFTIESLQYYSLISKKSGEHSPKYSRASKYSKLIEPSEEFYSFISDSFGIPFEIYTELNDLEDFEESIIECKSLMTINPADSPSKKTKSPSLNKSQNSISTNESHFETECATEIIPQFSAKFTVRSSSQAKACRIVIIGKDAFILKKEPNGQYTFKQIIPLRQVYCEQGSDLEAISDCPTAKAQYPLHIISTISHLYKDSLIFFNSIERLIKVKEEIEAKTLLRRIEDDYDIESQIDHGSYGQIFKARNKRSNEVYAVKAMTKLENKEQTACMDFIRNEQYISLFLKEVPLKGVISIQDIYESKETVYIVQEYVSYGNLFNYAHGHFEKKPETLSSLFSQLIESILHLQQYGIVHRDLKLENILLSCEKEGSSQLHTKLIDFGISKVILKEQQLKDLNGTFSYLPPEMIENHPYSHNIDVWAIGLIGYIMIYGFNPFKDETIEKMIRKRVITKLVFPHFTEKQKAMMRNVVISCLQENPIKRGQIEAIHQEWMKVYV